MLKRVRVVITAGGTREPVDDVRVLTNSSSGRFGAALAEAFHARGAEVLLIGAAAMSQLVRDLSADIQFLPFGSWRQLDAHLDEVLAQPADVLLMAAAVADYSPEPARGKIRSDEELMHISLRRNPKILTTLRARCGPEARIVGFKLLSDVSVDELLSTARRQREACSLDATFANDLRELGGDLHPAWWVTAGGAERLDGSPARVAATVAERSLETSAVRAEEASGWPRCARWEGWWQMPGALLLDTPVVEDVDELWRRDSWVRGPCWGRDEVPVVGTTRTEMAGWERSLDLARERLGSSFRPVIWRGRLVAAICGDDVLDLGAPADAAWANALAEAEGLHSLHLLGQAGGLVAGGWLRSEDRLLAPWTRPHGLAASACVVDLRGGRVLLGRRRGGPGEGAWAFPGGRREPGEGVLEAALRELEEETGMVIVGRDAAERGRFLTWTGEGPCWRIDTSVLHVLDAPEPDPSPELEARWVDLRDARRLSPLTWGTRRVLDALLD